MSKMKHLLRKLHIGGGGGGSVGRDDGGSSSLTDHHQQHLHGRLGDHPRIHHPPTASSSSTSSSSSSSRGRALEAASPSEPSGQGAQRCDEAGGGDFSFFEEEYQMQLALAMSVSDPDGREDPESAQIDAAKRMSLACSPAVPAATGGGAEALEEFLSLRYWSYNIVNYDEKVMDGFYDVYGIISNSNLQGKMPSLVDLQAISVTDNIDYEVVLVNRTIDHALQRLEREAVSISFECRSEELGPIENGLVQKIADLVVASMGGPVGDAGAMLRRWTMKSYELRTSLNTVVLPLGCLEVGLSRHRALLFKVLADRIDLPCRLVKGSYYTGTDEGAVNLIKVDYGSEYIIDLMGAPGALIPAEIPSSHLQNSGIDLVNSNTIAQTVKDLCLVLDKKVNSQYEKTTERSEGSSPESSLASETLSLQSQDKTVVRPLSEADDVSITERSNIERFEHDFGRLLPSLIRPQSNTCRTQKTASPAQQMKVDDISKYVVCAAKNPEFAPKLHAVLLESGASPPPDLFSDISSSLDLGEQKVLAEGICTEGDMKKESLLLPEKLVSGIDPSLVSFTEVRSLKSTDGKSEQKYSAEGSTGKQSKDADPHTNFISSCFHTPFATAHEGAMPINSGASEKVQTSLRALDIDLVLESAMPLRASHVYSAQNEVASGQMEPVNALTGRGSQCSQANAAGVVKNMEMKGNIHLKDGQGSVKDSMFKLSGMANNKSHDLSDATNRRVNQVLEDVAEWEIPWEDLQIGERIGLGSYGEVYHADWNGTEVAVKKFLDQGLSGDALEQFRCEVKIMLRLRHPNVVLFMGAVTRPPNLSILTEFLPRGSLYRLLHRPKAQLDEKRRLRMALDVAKGMNYLHTSHPTIVHRDLKSPNLLVDKNWVVKVSDFGLSRLQHHTYLSSKSTAGTPEWMAPEVLRNEDSNEKCDVYSFGVILWELATLRMPWSGLNPMQVVGAVGYQDKRLEIPNVVDPTVAQIISDCWHREPNQRPSFAQLMTPLKRLQRLVIENS